MRERYKKVLLFIDIVALHELLKYGLPNTFHIISIGNALIMLLIKDVTLPACNCFILNV